MIGVRNVVAIVCGGGPAPGINAVISAVTNTADRNGWDVLGMYDGFSHLGRGEKSYIRLDTSNVNENVAFQSHEERIRPSYRR